VVQLLNGVADHDSPPRPDRATLARSLWFDADRRLDLMRSLATFGYPHPDRSMFAKVPMFGMSEWPQIVKQGGARPMATRLRPVNPVVVGQGTRLFPHTGPDIALELITSRMARTPHGLEPPLRHTGDETERPRSFAAEAIRSSQVTIRERSAPNCCAVARWMASAINARSLTRIRSIRTRTS
jgi:hypothetical protein